MGLKTFGSGWDPNSGWAPDDSTDIPWQSETDLPGWKGGGQGFGPGGFQGNPRITANPAGPPPGLSLPTNTGGGAEPNYFGEVPFGERGHPFIGPRWGGSPPPGFNMGDGVVPPTNRTIPSGKQVGAWTNPFTEAHIDPITGQPEMLADPNLPSKSNLFGFNPASLFGGAPKRAALAGAGIIASTPTAQDEFNPPMVRGRPEAPLPLHMPHRPVTPTPATAYPPASGPATSAPAASPAVTRQRPNLGTYDAPPAAVANSPFTTFDRPNMSPQNSAQGRQGAEQMGMLDLSRLFGGGQPATAAAAPAPRPLVGNQPSIHMVDPGPSDPSIIARQRMKRPKSSNTSQGGGYNK